MYFSFACNYYVVSTVNTVVEYSTRHLEIKGSNPATDTDRKKIAT